MDEHTDTLARESFEDNIRLFAQPFQKPEQYNTYNGFAHLAAMLEELLRRVRSLEQRLDQRR